MWPPFGATVRTWDDMELDTRDMEQLLRLRAAVAKEYDPDLADRDRVWPRLWAALNPVGQLKNDYPGNISARWKDVGFQRDDPCSDIRASRWLGLSHVLNFAEQHSSFCRAYMSEFPTLPFCAVGLNISYNLTRHLLLHPTRTNAMPIYGGTSYSKSKGAAARFCCLAGKDNVDPELQFHIGEDGHREDLIAFAEQAFASGQAVEYLQKLFNIALRAVLSRWRAVGGGERSLLTMQSNVYPAGWSAVERHLLSTG